MASADKRKQSLYFPEEMLKEIQDEANRQDRSLSWIVQQAWRIARGEIKKFPSVNDVIDGDRLDAIGDAPGGVEQGRVDHREVLACFAARRNTAARRP